jgi:hypothetical protein
VLAAQRGSAGTQMGPSAVRDSPRDVRAEGEIGRVLWQPSCRGKPILEEPVAHHSFRVSLTPRYSHPVNRKGRKTLLRLAMNCSGLASCNLALQEKHCKHECGHNTPCPETGKNTRVDLRPVGLTNHTRVLIRERYASRVSYPADGGLKRRRLFLNR